MKNLRQFLRQFLRQLLRQRLHSQRPVGAQSISKSSRRGWQLAACAAVFGLSPAADNRQAMVKAPPSTRDLAVDLQALDGDAVGQGLLRAYQCGACHHIDGVSGAQGTRGPALAQLGQRSYLAGRVPNTPALLVQWIVDPSRLVPGTPMPTMGVTPDDARRMAAYLLRPA